MRLVLRERPHVEIVNLDVMSYCGNADNLGDAEADARYRFVRGDVAAAADVREALGSGVDAIVNFAAETHVDRSLSDAAPFIHANVTGVQVLLAAARTHGVTRFLQVSTDEVYGPAPDGTFFSESDPARPQNPYSSSKAEAERLVLQAHARGDVPAVITRGSNTYGPYQYPEKLIPLFVTNLVDDEPVPLYGDGMQVRDWLHAEDHARGVLHVLEHGVSGEAYNLSGENYRTNLQITQALVEGCGRSMSTHVRHVTDRVNHDRRYAMSGAKAEAIGWTPTIPFEDGLRETIAWYRTHEHWWRPLKARHDHEQSA